MDATPTLLAGLATLAWGGFGLMFLVAGWRASERDEMRWAWVYFGLGVVFLGLIGLLWRA